MDNLLPSLRSNERAATWLSYAIVCGMMVCAIVIAVRFGQALLPTWRGGYLVVVGFLVVLETFYTRRFRKNLIPLDQDWFVFYLSEFVVLVLLTKAFQLVWGGVEALSATITALRLDFAGSFFDTEFLFSLLALFTIWLVSVTFSNPLEVLRAGQENLQLEEDIGTYSERAVARGSLVDQVLLVGLVMVVMTSLMRSERTTGWLGHPSSRFEVILILVYFVLGLILLSLTQYSVMQMRWAINRIPTSRHVAANWALFGFVFLALIASVSLLLPTRHTIGLLTLLNVMVGILMGIIQLVVWLGLLAVALVAYFLGMLSGETPEQQPLPTAPLATPLPPTGGDETGIRILEWVGSILFWAVMVALVAYLLVYFFRARRQDLIRIARLPVFSTLFTLWRAMRDWMHQLRSQVSMAVRAGVQRLRPVPVTRFSGSPWRFTSLRRMTPRQQVIFYYLALVRRGGESGAPRGRSQTPYEYADRLSDVLENDPSGGEQVARADLEDITERFVEARYSRHAVHSEEASLVRQSWQRLKAALRRIHVPR